jgi:hypothetical protein
MGTQQFFALFGESMFLDTVETLLADVPQVGIVRIHPSVSDLASRLLSFEPDMVIVDLNAPSLHFVVSFLRERPGAPILGLDLARSQAILLTGRLYSAPTADHLLALIEHYAGSEWDVRSPLPTAFDSVTCGDLVHD